MATDVFVNGMNVGSDATVIIQVSDGRQFTAAQLGLLQDIDIDVQEDTIKGKTIVAGGITIIETIPGSVSVKLGFIRNTGNMMGLNIDYRQNYFNGKRLSYTVQVMVSNPDGGVDTYLVNNSKPNKASMGFKPDAAANQTLTFEGQDIQVTTAGGSSSLFGSSTAS